MSGGAKLEPAREVGLLKRPVNWAQRLPYAYRWEFTRRHPYYLAWWDWARAHYHHTYDDDRIRVHLAQTGMLILLNLGVSGDPSPPSASAESLECGQLAGQWQSGAVAPVTFGGLAAMMARDLSPAACRVIGAFLLDYAEAKGDAAKEFALVSQILQEGEAELKSLPNRPVVGINVEAPQRAIVEAIEAMVRKWKNDLAIHETRRRDEKLSDYLRVWDLREGWTQDTYDVGQECSFVKIASLTKMPIRTVANHYYAAFEHLAGHPYTFANWVRLFDVAKLETMYGTKAIRRRHYRCKEEADLPADLPKSAPSSRLEAEDRVDDGIGLPGAPDVQDLIMDINSLIQDRCSDDKIIKDLQLGSSGKKLVRYLRTRLRETASQSSVAPHIEASGAN